MTLLKGDFTAVAVHGLDDIGTDMKALCRGPSGSHSAVAPSSSKQLQEEPSRIPTSSFIFTQWRKFSVALYTEIHLSLLCQTMPLSNSFLKRFFDIGCTCKKFSQADISLDPLYVVEGNYFFSSTKVSAFFCFPLKLHASRK